MSIPEFIDKYRILSELSRSAGGVIYAAQDPVLERLVALKVLDPNLYTDEFRDTFRREALAVARLSHPNIVTLHEFHETDGSPNSLAYLVTEYIDGSSLEDIIQQGTHPLKIKLHLFMQITRALEHAHQQGIVHRDLKPANILVTTDGQVKVLDFGTAKLNSTDLTHSGLQLNNPGFYAPEYILGQAQDQRSDIFSAGALLYQLICGQRPFQGESAPRLLDQILNHPPTPPSRINSALQPVWDSLCAKALARDPKDRYQNIQDFAQAAERAIREQESDSGSRRATASAPSPATRPHPTKARTQPRPAGNHTRWPLRLTLLLLLCLSLGYAYLDFFGYPDFLRREPGLSLSTERGPNPVYRLGEAISALQVRIHKPGFVYCFYGSSQGVLRIYPNRFALERPLGAGEQLKIPEKNEFYFRFNQANTREAIQCYRSQDSVLTEINHLIGPGDLVALTPKNLKDLDNLLGTLPAIRDRHSLSIEIQN